MRNTILIFGAILLFLGCTSKEEKLLMQKYEKNKSYHKQLQKTETTKLYDGEFTKAILTATYLHNPKEKTENEVFVIGIYIEDGEEDLFSQEGYSLTLDDKAPKSFKVLEAEDDLLKHISLVSEWDHFYLVTFEHTPNESLKLIFESDMYGKGELRFAKVSKYVLTGKAF